MIRVFFEGWSALGEVPCHGHLEYAANKPKNPMPQMKEVNKNTLSVDIQSMQPRGPKMPNAPNEGGYNIYPKCRHLDYAEPYQNPIPQMKEVAKTGTPSVSIIPGAVGPQKSRTVVARFKP